MNWKKLIPAALAVVCAFSIAGAVFPAGLKALDTSTDKAGETTAYYDGGELISRGGYPEAKKTVDSVSQAYYSYNSSLASVLLSGFTSAASAIDVSSFRIPRSNVQAGLADTYYAVVNQNPQLFYLRTGFKYSYNSSTDCITSVQPMYWYSVSEIPAMQTQFNAKVNEILAQVNSSWSSLEKALFIHDYLVSHIAYDESQSKFDAYTAIVEGDTVCHGYSLAFSYLMSRLGITAKVVTSDAMQHAWNIVYINGSWYYMDATWDDPTHDMIGFVSHDNFLISESMMRSNGHTGTDWVADASKICGTVNNTNYDSAFWHGANCALPNNGRTWYYYNAGGNYIASYDFATNQTKALAPMSDKWYVWGSSTSSYKSNFTQMHILSGRLYFTTPTSIKSLALAGGDLRTDYTLTTTEASKGYIYITARVGNSINYGLMKQPFGGSITASGKFTPSATQALAKPVVKATPGDGKVTLSWNKVSGATQYKVYYYNNGKYDLLTTTTATSYTRTGLINGRSYQFLVRATNGTAWSPFTASDLVTAKPIAPLAKPVVKVTNGNGQATLSWNKISGATQYKVYYYNNGSYTLLTTTTATSYTRTGLVNGRSYQFLVRATNGTAWSPFTTADLVTAKPVAPLAKPVVKVTNGNGQATLTWNKVSGATQYKIYYYTGENYTLLATTTSTSYTRTGLINGRSYQFLVRATNGTAWSPFTASDLVTAKPIAPLAKPVVTVTNGNGQATLTWNKVSGATQYNIYYYNNGSYNLLASTSSTSYTRTGLINGRSYQFLVRATNGTAWSPFTASDLVTAKPAAPLAKPAVTVVNGNGQATLSWNKVSGATEYKIYYYSNGSYNLLATTPSTSYTRTGLINGRSYQFLVRATNGTSWSSFTESDLVTARPMA